MHGVEGTLANGASFIADVSDEEGFRLITVPSVHDAGDIDIDDIAIVENIVTWDAVADDVVHTRAAAFGVSEVPKGGRCVSVLNGVVVCESIDFTGGDACLDKTTEVIHQLSVEASGGAHAIALDFGKLQFAQVLQHLSLGSDGVWGAPLDASIHQETGIRVEEVLGWAANRTDLGTRCEIDLKQDLSALA